MRTRLTLVAVSTALAVTAFPAAGAARGCPGANASVRHTATASLRRAVLCLVNDERTSRGLPPLRESSRLERSAQRWSAYLVGTHTFGHGPDFAARISAAGFRWNYAGENIATGFPTPRRVVQAWMHSRGHCQNILDPQFAWLGTGVVGRPTAGGWSGGTWTQDFGTLMGRPVPSHDWGPASACPY